MNFGVLTATMAGAFHCGLEKAELLPVFAPECAASARAPVDPLAGTFHCERGLLPLHHVTGHRPQCMSAAIGPTAVHIGTDTVGSIRASACASKRPQLILRPFQQLRPLAILIAIRRASSRVSKPAAVRLPASSSKLMYTSACPVFSLCCAMRALPHAGLIAVAEGASIRLRRCGVVTGAWGTTERRQLALSSAELHHGATRAKRLCASAEVVGRTVWLGKPRGIPTGAQIFHRKGPRRRNGPSADGVRDRHGEQGDRRATQVCRPNHRDPRRLSVLLWGRLFGRNSGFFSCI